MKPVVIWLTGLSGAGKTTIANALNEKLKADGIRSAIADGDILRQDSQKPIGFDMESRRHAVNNMIYAVRNMIEFQKAEVVIVAMISPLREMRNNARDILTKYSDAKFVEVYVNTSLEICEQRDPKGLYKKVRAGIIKDFTGIDSPYEAPDQPEIIIENQTDVNKAVEIILEKSVAGS
jgi:adenylylsulfate kinase